MLYDYLLENYKNGEPIFLSELSGYSKDYIRQEMKRLTDEGKIERLYNGVYFVPYTSILGSKGKVSIKRIIEKKFLGSNGNVSGYYTGLTLMNLLGFTTQNPAFYEICTNNASTKQRKLIIDSVNMIIYEPVVQITNENYKELQFLDLMTSIDKYCELKTEEMIIKLKEVVKNFSINFELVKQYLPLYPDKIYKNIYNGGLMNELV